MMYVLEIPTVYLWLMGGAVLIALEVFGIPGIGLLFAGLAATLVGTLLQFHVLGLDDFTLQFAIWFLTTALIAALLWHPLKRWRSPKTGTQEYSNIIGDHATICDGDLVRGSIGHVRWSGTTMLAEIDPIADALKIAEGTAVQITNLRGNKLSVMPLGSRRMEEII